MGPLISSNHRARVKGYVDAAREQGADVVVGGEDATVPGFEGGFFLQPTVINGVRNDMTVAQEEICGPVIALIPFDDDEDAIRIANDSRFGLAGSVFTSDPARGFEIARRVRAGTFSVNTFAADFNSPFGGYKESGIGREHGPTAIEEYLLYKTISVDPGEGLPDEVVRSVERTPAPA
jgi:aldehyde dehydrogenase (NAD+)